MKLCLLFVGMVWALSHGPSLPPDPWESFRLADEPVIIIVNAV